MRISTNQFHSQALSGIQDHQARVAELQSQLATGRRILNPSDAPADSARLMEIQQELGASEQFQRNIAFSTGRLALEETALDSAGDLLQRARELVVQGNNAPLSDSDRASIATEIRQITDQMQDVANSKDGQGDYLFGGHRVSQTPFVKDDQGRVVYRGDQGQRQVQIGASRTVAVGDSGAEVFRVKPNGLGSVQVTADGANSGSGSLTPAALDNPLALSQSGLAIQITGAGTFDVIDPADGSTLESGRSYTPGVAVDVGGVSFAVDGSPAAGDSFTLAPAGGAGMFDTLERLATALETPLQDDETLTANFHAAMAQGLGEIDGHLDHLNTVRSKVGARLNALDNQEQVNAAFQERMEAVRSRVEDVDYAEAATRLNEELVGLQAAQQSFIKIQGLSLFNFL